MQHISKLFLKFVDVEQTFSFKCFLRELAEIIKVYIYFRVKPKRIYFLFAALDNF